MSRAPLSTLSYLSFADYLAARGPDLVEEDWRRHATKVSHILSEGTRPEIDPALPPLVNGHDLMQVFNLPPGPRIGQLLEQVREAEAAGEVASKEDALAWVGHFLGIEAERVLVTMPSTKRTEG